MFSDHNEIKLETNNRETRGKSPNTWKFSNTIISNIPKRKSQRKI